MRPAHPVLLRDRLRRPLRRWAPYLTIALALLAASQMLWQWQTWPVRDLLANSSEASP